LDDREVEEGTEGRLEKGDGRGGRAVGKKGVGLLGCPPELYWINGHLLRDIPAFAWAVVEQAVPRANLA